MSRVLVTGANGFVGRVLCSLLRADHEVLALDNGRSADRRDGGVVSDPTAVRVDVTNIGALRSVADDFEPDVVVHLAAIHFIPDCDRHPAECVATNVLGTSNVCQVCRPGTRVVFASSAAVYAPSEDPHDELVSNTGPVDIYGITKLQGEALVGYWAVRNDLAATSIRLFNVVGPGETNPHLIPAIASQLRAGARTVSLGNLEPRRDYVHVADAASGFAAAAFADRQPGVADVVNLGTGSSYSVKEVVDLFAELIGAPITVVQDPSRVRRVDRPELAADTARMSEEYGWSTRRTLREAITDLWAAPAELNLPG